MKFVYNVKDVMGRLKTGKIHAESREEVIDLLRKRGNRILSIYEVAEDSEEEEDD